MYRSSGLFLFDIAFFFFLCDNRSKMSKALNFLKQHWQPLAILVLGFLLVKKSAVTPLSYRSSNSQTSQIAEIGGVGLDSSMSLPYPVPEAAPAPDVKDRLVVQNSYLSLLVKGVRVASEGIIKKAEELGGYMVESSLDSPEGVDSATVSVRVPAKKLDEFLVVVRGLGVRVVSENLIGYDVTDQYVDLEARLATLNKTKAKFEEIMTKATEIEDILTVERELVSLQEQIDSLKGQQLYLEKNAEMAKVTVYLSTDELALPYAPAQLWRPSVIFKTAVRALVQATRDVVSILIWVAVFSVIWVPILVILFVIKKIRK